MEGSALSLARLSPPPSSSSSKKPFILPQGENHSTNSVRAYAKLQSKGWEYYVQKLAIVLGRDAEFDSSSANASGVDVFLGPCEGISRKHLRIEYNTAERYWELYCFGKSGVIVNGERYEPFCHPVPLSSR